LRMIFSIDIKNCFSQNLASGDLEHELISTIDEDELSRADVLHDDCDWNILDNRFEELPRLIQLPLSLQMRGNVLVNGNGAAIGHWPAADGQGSAVLELIDDVVGIGPERFLHPIHHVFLRIARATSGSYSRLQNLRQRYPSFDLIRIKAVHRAVEIIGQNESFVGTKHANSVRHVRERRVQKHVGVFKTPFCTLTRQLPPHAEDGDGEYQQA